MILENGAAASCSLETRLPKAKKGFCQAVESGLATSRLSLRVPNFLGS